MTSSVEECALRARSTHGVHHAIVEVNIVIGVVLGEVLVARIVPLVVDAVIGLTLGLIAHVVIVVFVVAILHTIFLYGDILFTQRGEKMDFLGGSKKKARNVGFPPFETPTFWAQPLLSLIFVGF